MPSSFLPEFTARPQSHRFCPLLTRTTKVLYNKFNRNDGNIKTVTLGGKTTTYTYDKLNQLTREDNQAGNFTYVWEYDDGGNILSRKKYAYTTGNLGAPTEIVNYGYGNANWGDLLTSYKGSNISYDTIGNVLNDGTRTYTWEHGRELVALTKDGIAWSYTYDANGMRTQRASNYATYRYFYNGGLLTGMAIGTTPLYFTYDASGMPMTVTYNGTVYYYVTNLQGDVVAILNNSGVVVVEYTYDAWGNVLSTTGDLANTLGYYNPLRYRGYVYDEETGLYYLQSRYYNPEWGRFINADVLISTGQGLLGYNMFAYCGNNSTGSKSIGLSHGVSTTNFSPSVLANTPNNSSAKNSTSIKSSGFVWFGLEWRESAGWDNSELINLGVARFGFSSYITHTKGQSGFLYCFAGETLDIMNSTGITQYVGVGINVNSVIGYEIQLEAVGIANSLRIGRLSWSNNVNLIGSASITIGWDTEIEDGITQTDGFTIEVNTGLILGLVYGLYECFTTGNPQTLRKLLSK